MVVGEFIVLYSKRGVLRDLNVKWGTTRAVDEVGEEELEEACFGARKRKNNDEKSFGQGETFVGTSERQEVAAVVKNIEKMK